jgi:pimeloyl-ACP methyl ester carboxylesterase
MSAAHLVGASLGGAIAQTMAIEHPARVLPLTSMMSTTGDPTVGHIHPATMKAVFGGQATAAAIPGAELVLIDGMGHDLAPGLWDRLADHIAGVVQRDKSARARQLR